MQELQSCDDLHPWREQNGKEFFPFKILNLFLYCCYNVFIISFAYSSESFRLLKRLRELSMMLCASSVTSWGITALCTVAEHRRSPVLSQSTWQLIRYTIFRVICTPHALNPEVQEIFRSSLCLKCSASFPVPLSGTVCHESVRWCSGGHSYGTSREQRFEPHSNNDRGQSPTSQGKQPCTWNWLPTFINKWYGLLYYTLVI